VAGAGIKSEIIRIKLLKYKILFENRNMRKLLIIIYLFIQSLSSGAQDSLAYYLDLSTKNNPAVLQKYAEYKASLQKIPQAASLPDPEVTAGFYLSPMEQVGGKQVADFRIMQMLPWFGVLRNAKDEMCLMAKAKYESYLDSKLQVYYEVQRSVYEILKLKQDLKVAQQNIDILQTLERLAVIKFKVSPSGSASSASLNINPIASTTTSNGGGMNKMSGRVGNSNLNPKSSPMSNSPMSNSSGPGLVDVYRVQIEISDLQNTIEQTKNQVLTLSAQLNGLLDRPVATTVALLDTLVVVQLKPEFLTHSDSLLRSNPMLGMIQFEFQSLEARKQMVTKMGYPMVGFGLNYAMINKSDMSVSPMNGRDMVMPMLTVTLPLYRKKYKAMRDETDFLKTANVQSYKSAANTLQTEYYQALQRYHDAQRRIKLYADQTQLSNKSLEIQIRNFGASGIALAELLTVRQQNLDYQYKRIQAIADANISSAWIMRLMGLRLVN